MFIGNRLHYERIREARKLKNLDVNGIRQIDILDSKFLNSYIIDTKTNKEYLVERDYKEYSCLGFGWYKVMLLNNNGSHRILIYENINNDDETIKWIIGIAQENFKL